MTERKAKLAYLEGFVTGLNRKFEEQVSNSTALVLYREIPQHVLDAYEQRSEGFKTSYNKPKSYAGQARDAFRSGIKDGENFGSHTKTLK